MSSNGTHIIRKQYLDVTFEGDERNGMALQQRITSMFTGELMPALEAVLERSGPTDGHLYIDRLEIDLGDLSLDDLDGQLKAIFAEKLESSIREMAHRGAVQMQTRVPVFDENVRWSDDAVATVEAFCYFLETGRLPWHFRLPPKQTLEKQVMEILKSNSRRTAFAQTILQVLRQPGARERLVLQSSGQLPEMLFNAWDAHDIALLITDLYGFFPEKDYALLRRHIFTAGLELLATGQTVSEREVIFRAALKQLAQLQQPAAQTTLRQLSAAVQALPKDLKAVWQSNAFAATDTDAPPGTENRFIPTDADGIFIDNAGMVLLHPFLPRLFKATKIAENDRIADPDRALLLLHFLATGNMEAPEYEMPFSKILCGIPLETPVDAGVMLTKEDLEEANALLTAVIRHWAALQNTSHDGLRGGFLWRPGKLTATPDGEWLLQVERQSFDILLDQLPWGISMIQLPWMDRLLRVEWS